MLDAAFPEEVHLGPPGRARDAHPNAVERWPLGHVPKIGEDGRRDASANDGDDAALDLELGDRHGAPCSDVERTERCRREESGKEDRGVQGSSFSGRARGSGFTLATSSVSTRAFFDDAAKAAVSAAIKRVESQTSAEVVVAVRRQAGVSYLDADLGFGALVALASLALLLFVDKEFATTWIPADVAISFVVGALLCRHTWFIRRLLTPGSRRREETRRAAATAFQELGIGRTSGKNGILVLVALFEHEIAVVSDVGVDPKVIGASVRALESSVERAIPSFDAFIAALESLGPALAPVMPRRADDVNELPDEVA